MLFAYVKTSGINFIFILKVAYVLDRRKQLHTVTWPKEGWLLKRACKLKFNNISGQGSTKQLSICNSEEASFAAHSLTRRSLTECVEHVPEVLVEHV